MHRSTWTDKLATIPLPSIGVVLGLASLLRLLSIVLVRSFLHPVTWEFGPLAENLSAGLGYSQRLPNGLLVPAIYMPPAYPYLLALFYRLGGERPATYIALEILQAACGVLLVYLVYRLANLLAGLRAGLGAALLVAIYPTQIYLCNEFHGISVYIVLGVASVFFLIRNLSGTHSWKDLIAGGLCSGALMLFRAEAVGLILIYAAIFIFQSRFKAWAQAIAFLIIAFGCLVPWIVRNYETFHRFIPVCASGGYNLYVGNNPVATGSQHDDKLWNPLPADVKSAFSAIPSGPNERVQKDDVLKHLALNYMETHPLEEAKLAFRKLWIFFVFDPAHDKGRNPVYWLPSLLLTFLGVCGAWLRGRKLLGEDLLMVSSILFTIAVSVAIFVLPRYKIAVDPFIMILAAYLVAARELSESSANPRVSLMAERT